MRKNLYTYFTQAKSIEKMGLIPRSIIRTFERFRIQLGSNTENLVLQEFKLSRYQFLVSFNSFFCLFLFPFFVNPAIKKFLCQPLVEYIWNSGYSTIFLNASQEKRALQQIENFEDKLYFESLIMPHQSENLNGQLDDTLQVCYINPCDYFEEKISEKYLEFATQFNNESIDAIANLITDALTLIGFIGLLSLMQPQLTIFRSFLTELLYSFGDTTKSFLLIFITDLFVGFHSPHAWEVFLESSMIHFGFAENEDFIFLFVATVPVLLDTIIKYWIFRYLNRISPSTVATYHTMIE